MAKPIRRFLLTDILYLKIFIAFSIGILVSEFLHIFSAFFVPFLAFLLFQLGYFYFKIQRSKWLDSLVFSSIILLGILFHYFSCYKQNEAITQLNTIIGKNAYHFVRLDEKPLFKANSVKIEGKLLSSVLEDKTKYNFDEKLIIYIPKEQAIDSNYYGKIYQFYGKVQYPQSANYSFEFDYKKWLSRKGIFATLYSKDFQIVGKDESPLYYFRTIPIRLRDYFERQIDKFILEPTSNDIAKSLLIGVRSDVDKDLYEAYSDTGTIHILSVSGLHFGILIIFLDWLLSFFIKNEKIKFVVKHLFSISYALITGFSPPVIRSFLMFLFIDILKISKNKTSHYNILFLSAWLILLFDTNQLFDVGYQLSYVALLGIMICYQRILWKVQFNRFIPNFLWKSTATMLSAWLFTLPFTIYYFNKISMLGMFSNFLVLPITAACMYLGFGMMFLSLFNYFSFVDVLNAGVGYGLSILIYLQNQIILFFSKIPLATIFPIYFDTSSLIISLFALLFLVLFMRMKERWSLRLFLLFFTILLGLNSFQKYQKSASTSWYIVPNSKFSTIIYKNKQSLYLFSDSVDENTGRFFIDKLAMESHIDSIYKYSSSSYFEGIRMKYSLNPSANAQFQILARENKEDWENMINQRDSFVLLRNLGFKKEELINQLKSKNRYYIEN